MNLSFQTDQPFPEKDIESLRKKIQSIYDPFREALRQDPEKKKGIPTKWNPESVLLVLKPNELIITLKTTSYVNLFTLAPKKSFTLKGVTFSKPLVVEEYVHSDTKTTFSEGKKWNTLVHNGVYFGEPYKPLGLKFGGQVLPPNEEENVYVYAQRIASERGNPNNVQYTNDRLFNINYLRDLKIFSPTAWDIIHSRAKSPGSIPKNLFEPFVLAIEDKKAKKKGAAGLIEKEKTEAIRQSYGYATVDGRKEKISNFTVEKPGLLLGRGDNPRRGCLKARIHSKDVTLNLGKDARVPVASDGGKWGGIVHNNEVTWLAMWKDRCGGTVKYVWLAPTSSFKASGAQEKFEKARRLGKAIEELEKSYWKLMNGTNKEKQLGVVLYLIHQFAFRIGNEKSSEETDTVGATTLRVEHLSFPGSPKRTPPRGTPRGTLPKRTPPRGTPPRGTPKRSPPKRGTPKRSPPKRSPGATRVRFNFLGKDSMRYDQIHSLDPKVYSLLRSWVVGSSPEKSVFDQISSSSVNEYLKKFGDGITAKVIRTYKASITYYEKLCRAKKGMSELELIQLERKANHEVAKVCNHQKKASIAARKSITTLKAKIKELQEKVKLATTEKQKLAATNALKKARLSLEEKKLNLEISCGTSKQNYIDPRITVAFAKKWGLEMNSVFPAAALRTRFKWAIETTPANWVY